MGATPLPLTLILNIPRSRSTVQIWNSGLQRDSLEKTLMLGKMEGTRRRGQQRMRWLDSVLEATSMSLAKLQGGIER